MATLARRSSRTRSSSGSSSLLLFGLAGAGAVAYLLSSKKASAAPGTSPAAPSKPTGELSEYLKQQMATALGMLGVNPTTGELVPGAANAEAIQFASQVVGQLDQQGYHDAASALRVYVDKAAQQVQTPASAAPIAAATPTILTQDQRDYIARVLTLERDPAKIQLLVNWLKTLPPSAERDSTIEMAQALILQLAAAQSTSNTLQRIDEVIKAPDAASAEKAAAVPLPQVLVPLPIPSGSVTPPSPPPKVVPSFVPVQTATPTPSAPPPSILPNSPIVVPNSPVPQTVPAPASPEELAAKAMIVNLLTVQAAKGVTGAKTAYDKALVQKFQSLTNLAPDGVPGPATLILAAGKGAVTLPLVYFWPKTATAATVQEYRTALGSIADKMQSVGRLTEANILRVALARETGQSGINGPAFGSAAAAPKPAPAPSAAPKPAAPKPAAAVSTPDPTPGVPILKKGDKGSMVTSWQNRLKKKYPAIVADGSFGPASDAATRQFQTSMGIQADGQVGPNTRIAAVRAGIW